jgi:hypothetical protein
MRGIFGRRCSTGDFQVRSGYRYPIHKLEMKRSLVFWDVALCSHIEVDQRFRGAKVHTRRRENLKSHAEMKHFSFII